MIPADAGSKHAVVRTVRGHPGLQPVKKESLTNIYYNNWYKNNETFKNPFIFTILPYGQSDRRIGIPYRAHTCRNSLPAGMTGHMSGPRIRCR